MGLRDLRRQARMGHGSAGVGPAADGAVAVGAVARTPARLATRNGAVVNEKMPVIAWSIRLKMLFFEMPRFRARQVYGMISRRYPAEAMMPRM